LVNKPQYLVSLPFQDLYNGNTKQALFEYIANTKMKIRGKNSFTVPLIQENYCSSGILLKKVYMKFMRFSIQSIMVQLQILQAR